MYKNSALLSIGAALLLSLFFFDVGLASDIDKKLNGSVLIAADMNAPPTQGGSNQPNPCMDPGAPCRKHTPPVSGDKATDGSACTSGYACNSPNVQKCGYSDAGTCKNIPLGGGSCSCNCVMP